MLTLVCALLSLSSPDLEVCLQAVRSHCFEISCENGQVLDGGQIACDPVSYDQCLKPGEAACHLRYPDNGGDP